MRRIARQMAFLLIYSTDMGVASATEVLDHYLAVSTFEEALKKDEAASDEAAVADYFKDERLEDFIEATDIGAGMTELSADQLASPIDVSDVRYIAEMVRGTQDQQEEIDALIEKYAKNWRTLRMLSSDRNILRLGVYELLYATEQTDAAVIINEGVELAKIYGEAESYKFVNAILDAVAKDRQAS